MKNFLLGMLVAVTAWAGAARAEAAPLPNPTSRTILTVSGKIASTNKGETAEFDRAMLESLGMVSFETETPWYNGKTKFEGIPLSKLMQHLGAKGEHLLVVALNDYSSDIPMADVMKYNVLLALKINDEYISVKDKGPLFIIYPFDSAPELKSQAYFGRSVWQIAKIIVK
jgi:hypothetical protein